MAFLGQRLEPVCTLQRGRKRFLLQSLEMLALWIPKALWLCVQPPVPEPRRLDTTSQRLWETTGAGDEAPGPEAAAESCVLAAQPLTGRSGRQGRKGRPGARAAGPGLWQALCQALFQAVQLNSLHAREV